MKNHFFYLLLIVCEISYAQEFKPSQQAQGYLEGKNTTVDFSTGIFHYKIPLFKLKVGESEFPVQLDYTGRGVKPADMLGIAGKNWNLRTGGVITRTKENSEYNVQNDIYTLVINESTVHFWLENNVVVPLEKTNVKIRYNPAKDTWVVTDEKGMKYYFDVPEVTKNAVIEDPISLYIKEQHTYTSSWFPSKIIAQNGESIIFKYSIPYSKRYAFLIDSISCLMGSQNLYFYGRVMLRWPFDFSSCQREFQQALDNAYRAIQQQYNQERINTTISILDQMTGETYYNPAYDAKVENLKLHKQIMGLLIDMREIGKYTYELFNLLKEISERYKTNAIAHSYLRTAKEILAREVKKTVPVGFNLYTNYTMYTIMPAYLEKIVCNGQEINLKYHTGYTIGSNYRELSEIDILDNHKDLSRKINFTINKNLLKSITWKNPHDVILKTYNFSYFHEQGLNPSFTERRQLVADYWGFYSNRPNTIQDSVLAYLPDENYVKAQSLQKITLPGGGEIEIDYEQNRHGGLENNDIFGGIRIKHLVFKNNEGYVDSIKYYYPGSGRLLYDNYLVREWVNYPSGVRDRVIKSLAKFLGHAYVNTGNNGLLYDYVIEEFKGKGYNSYLFSVPKSSSFQPDNTYPFWLCGLPLAQGTYDKNGNLVQLQKMKYFTDMSTCNITENTNDWFCAGNPAFNYTGKTYQLVVSEYYIDEQAARNSQTDEKPILIYEDPELGTYHHNPIWAYEQNVAPRTNACNSHFSYQAYHGGKTLLKEIETYQFSGNISASLDKGHLTGILPSGTCFTDKIEFIYDTRNTSPIGVKKIHSNGDEEVTLRKNALCFESGVLAVIDEMRDSNNLVPLKEQKLMREAGASNYTLLYDKVIRPKDTLSPILGKAFLPVIIYSYNGENAPYQGNNFSSLERSLFSTDQAYTLEERVKYVLQGQSYHVSGKEYPGGSDAFCHEKERENIILEVKNISPEYIAATDVYRKTLDAKALYSEVQLLDSLHKSLQQQMFLVHQGFNLKEPSMLPYPYLKTPSFLRMYHYLQKIVEHKENYDFLSYMADSVLHYSIPESQAGFSSLPFLMQYFLKPTIPLAEKFCKMKKEEYELLSLMLDGDVALASETEELTVAVNDLHHRFSVKILSIPTASTFTLNYKIMKGGTVYARSATARGLVPGCQQLFTLDIDAGEIAGATSLGVTIPLSGHGISLAVLVPEHSVYNAISYDRIGNVSCKFDQKGQMERYEYDGLNRVTKVFDKDGNVLKEYVYNLPNNK